MLWKPSRKKPIAKPIRAICSQKMRRRISGPKARRARAAEVATSMKVHKGSAQAKREMASGSRETSCGAAEKKLATPAACHETSAAIRAAGPTETISASLTAPWASSSRSWVGTTRCSALVIERLTMLVIRLTAAHSTT